VIEFEWDKVKAESNEKKHGVSFSEASTIFCDPLEITIEDPKHSSGEYRFRVLEDQAQEICLSYPILKENRI